MERYFIGESAICWPLGKTISAACSVRVLRVYRTLKELQKNAKLDVLDVVPSYTSITVYFRPVSADIHHIQNRVQAVIEEDDRTAVANALTSDTMGKEIVLSVQYDGEDLERVAAHCGLSQKDVVSLHVNATYTVAMIGFLPHFPYLVGLHEKLTTSRLDEPRTRVPAGSVAIGGNQTGVYPCVSPGGWNIIGTTDPELLVPLVPGDRVVFRELS